MTTPEANDMLPVAAAGGPKPATIPSMESGSGRPTVVQIAVLVVDDSAVIRALVAGHLRHRGLLVAEAGDGQEALEALAVRKFDILITDLEMPRLDGHALLEAVQDQYPLMRRVVMTGFTTIENALDALKLGAVGFVPKPVDTVVLDEVIDLAVAEMRSWLRQLTAIRRLPRQGGLEHADRAGPRTAGRLPR